MMIIRTRSSVPAGSEGKHTEARAENQPAIHSAVQFKSAQAPNSKDDVLLAGYLQKRKAGEKRMIGKNWNTRFFVLYSNVLQYYENMASKKVSGCLDLRGVISVRAIDCGRDRKKEGRFAVQTATREYIMQAENLIEAANWVKALQFAVKSTKAAEAEAPPQPPELESVQPLHTPCPPSALVNNKARSPITPGSIESDEDRSHAETVHVKSPTDSEATDSSLRRPVPRRQRTTASEPLRSGGARTGRANDSEDGTDSATSPVDLARELPHDPHLEPDSSDYDSEGNAPTWWKSIPTDQPKAASLKPNRRAVTSKPAHRREPSLEEATSVFEAPAKHAISDSPSEKQYSPITKPPKQAPKNEPGPITIRAPPQAAIKRATHVRASSWDDDLDISDIDG
jgi:hypothetical protein